MLPSVRTQIEATIARHVGEAIVKQSIQQGNVVHRSAVLAYAKSIFAGTASCYMYFWPWRLPSQYDGQDLSVLAFNYHWATSQPNASYSGKATSLANVDHGRARRYATPWTFDKADWRESIGAILVSGGSAAPEALVVTASDVPLRYIGTPWGHPAMAGTVTITLGGIGGASYLTTFATFDSASASPGTAGLGAPPANGCAFLRIIDGADPGLYRVRFIDTLNSRMYLSNLDGSNFVSVAAGTQTNVRVVLYSRIATYFNEATVIPASKGIVTFGGNFDPGVHRASFMFRLHYAKTGSPTPAGGAHLTGSYWFTVRPWTFGHGSDAVTYPSNGDNANLSSCLTPLTRGYLMPTASAGIAGGCPGAALDAVNQRLWVCSDDGTNSAIWWWLYKSPECAHEVASNNLTALQPNSPIAGITMAGARARALEMGTDGTVYVALGGGANAGAVKITTGLVATQWLASAAGLGAAVNGLKVDKSRARTGGAATASTDGANRIGATDGTFTQADVGRAIALTGLGADDGTYKISAYVDATHVDVTTLAGGAVVFTNQAGGQFQIGDRIYLFWNDATSWAGSGAGFISMRYMESLAFGTILTTGDLAVVASTGRTLYDGHATCRGNQPAAAVDPLTGNLFWSSSDTAKRLNRFDVTSRTVSQKTVASFTKPADASALADPATLYGIGVNPHASFREVWLATDIGVIRFSPDHADLSTLTTGAYVNPLPANEYRRYYGSGVNTAYTQPANHTRPSGETYDPNIHEFFSFFFGPDGKVFSHLRDSSIAEIPRYLREQDLFIPGTIPQSFFANSTETTTASFYFALPSGEYMRFIHHISDILVSIGSMPVDYQWDGGAWVAKEAVHGPIPDATSQPGLLAKPLHAASEDLLHGVKVAFATGAGSDTVQFIGRMSQKQAQQTDGAWFGGNFTGSNFTAADVGRLLRVESGANQGVYLVSAFVGANTITVKTLARAAFAPADAAAPNYTLWDLGAVDAGAETCTCLAANGICPDNAQDVTNISAEMFLMRTLLSEQVEGLKVALGPIPPVGSSGMVVYHDSYPTTANNVSPGIPSGLALSGAVLANGVAGLLDYAAGRYSNDGANGTIAAALQATLAGVDVLNKLSGFATTVDLGTEVEIGAVIVRLKAHSVDLAPALYSEALNSAGSINLLHKASTTAPVASATVTHRRGALTGVTGLGVPRALSADGVGRGVDATLTAGDFIGAATGPYNDGVTVQGENTFASAAGRFTGREGAVVRLTSGLDTGYYRITAVSPDGSTATVRNLNQTAKAWGSSATNLDFVIHVDAAREEDILLSGTFKTTVEMLTSPTVARVRTFPAVALVNATWEVLTPTWALVKRCSVHTLALPPEVVGNKTYVASDGRDIATGASANDGTMKCVFDLSDLPATQRTGRWWKFSQCGRFATSIGLSAPSILNVEFYDTTGKRLLAGPNGQLDTVESEADFFACHVTRLDWIQALYAASAVVPGVNALASLGGVLGNTVTLAGGAAFRGLQVGPTGGSLTVDASGYVNITGADRPFTQADVGRIIWIQAGANAGYYRIVTVASGVQVTSVVRPSGTAVTLAVDAVARAWSLHEGVKTGAADMDFINLVGTGELSIFGISDDLLTITTNEATYAAAANVAWEIRRRAVPVAYGAAAGVDAAKVARLLYTYWEQPRQPGDVAQDHRGALCFHAADIGTPIVRADGVIAGGSGAFTGTAFTKDDVGRSLLISTGANKGPWRISAFTSATDITVVDARTGAAAVLAADAGPVSYAVVGEKRFRASRYATVLRQ